MNRIALSTAAGALLMAVSGTALGSTGSVLLGSQQCGYVLVDKEQGGFAMMRITGAGEFPDAGDMLHFDNPLPENDFVRVEHTTSGNSFNAWVESVIRDDSRAVSRYHRRCG